MPDLQDAVQALDHASGMNDRWLFLAILVIFLGALFVAIRWLLNYFTTRTDKLEREIIEVRKEYVDYIKGEGAKSTALLQKCVEILERMQPHEIAKR